MHLSDVGCSGSIFKNDGIRSFSTPYNFRGSGDKESWKIAILYRPKDSFDRAKFFELCAQNEGYQVGAFQVFEEAIAWLYPHQDV